MLLQVACSDAGVDSLACNFEATLDGSALEDSGCMRIVTLKCIRHRKGKSIDLTVDDFQEMEETE